MTTRYDNINLFNIKPCQNGFNCKYLEKGLCNFKHCYVCDDSVKNKLYNDKVHRSNMYAIKNSIKHNHKHLEKLIHSYKNVQENLNRSKELNVKEKLLNEKKIQLDFKELQIERTKRKNNEIYLERVSILSRKFLEQKRVFDEQNNILIHKTNTLDKLIQEYNCKLSNIDCKRFIDFGEEKKEEILDSNVCDICLTSIKEVNGIDSLFNILDCGHSFCYKCTEELTKNKSLIKCPTCRNEYTVNSIKRNITLEKLIENIKTS